MQLTLHYWITQGVKLVITLANKGFFKSQVWDNLLILPQRPKGTRGPHISTGCIHWSGTWFNNRHPMTVFWEHGGTDTLLFWWSLHQPEELPFLFKSFHNICLSHLSLTSYLFVYIERPLLNTSWPPFDPYNKFGIVQRNFSSAEQYNSAGGTLELYKKVL